MKINTEKPILAAILAEMREEAANDREDSPDSPYNAFADVLESYASRVDAAADRMVDEYCAIIHEKDAAYDQLLLERDKAIKARAPGNSAALREALEQCGRALEKAQCSSAFQAANTESSYIAAALSSAHAALAEPARNCDVGTAADALAAYTKDRDLALSPEAQDAIWWLFEKAEKEETK